ncbi:MAG: hydrogenase iron-sulfur subunit [bacterium]
MDREIRVYICHNSIPEGEDVPHQWDQDNCHVVVKKIPCTGKITTQYLFHAFEGGIDGILIVACPQGQCTLNQGNYRAQVRVHNARRILHEIGYEPERVELLHYGDHDKQPLMETIRTAISQFSQRSTEVGVGSFNETWE